MTLFAKQAVSESKACGADIHRIQGGSATYMIGGVYGNQLTTEMCVVLTVTNGPQICRKGTRRSCVPFTGVQPRDRRVRRNETPAGTAPAQTPHAAHGRAAHPRPSRVSGGHGSQAAV